MKHRFDHGKMYAAFRPTYPSEFFDMLFTHLPSRLPSRALTALDVGTGTGQVALELARYCESVDAIDISTSQLEHAVKKPNIRYHLSPAERLPFPDRSFDLITVGQAVHWFQFEDFYGEARRVAKPNALLALLGYGNIQLPPKLQAIVSRFYSETLGEYWDRERRYIDEGYQTIPFPFEEIELPKFHIEVSWQLEQLLGYLSTWSAVKRYQESTAQHPLDQLQSEMLKLCNPTSIIPASFPLLCRLGKIR